MGDANNDFELPDLVARLREDLQIAMEEGEGQPIKFKLESVEIELKVVAKKTGEGRAGIKFHVINAEGGRKIENEHTQTVKLKMVPEREGGGSVAISKSMTERPRVPSGAVGSKGNE